MPEARRQVPRQIFHRSYGPAALQFGFEMGTGVRTYLSAGAPYLLALSLLFSSVPASIAVASGAAFGLGRLLTPVARQSSTQGETWDLTLARQSNGLAVWACLLCGLLLIAA